MKKLHFSILLACLLILVISCKDGQTSAPRTDVSPSNEATIAMAENVGVYDILKDPAYGKQAKE